MNQKPDERMTVEDWQNTAKATYGALEETAAENNRLRDALQVQKEIWELAEPILNQIDDRDFRVRFMEMWRPIEKIDHALNTNQTTDTDDYRSGEE